MGTISTLNFAEEANGKKSYERSCKHSSNFNKYTERCERCKAWGKKRRHCVCATEHCNHSDHTTPSTSPLIFLAIIVFATCYSYIVGL